MPLHGQDIHVNKSAFYLFVFESFVYGIICMILLNYETEEKGS